MRSVKEEMPGISDILVLQKAKELFAIILTFDKDYGEIIYRNELLSMIKSGLFELEGFFTVVEADNIRQRKIK